MKKLPEDYPPELKGFHTKNMFHALVVFMIPVIAGGWAFYRQEQFDAKDSLQTTLFWICMIGVGFFMVTLLYKALVSLPKCPKCDAKMQQEETVTICEKNVFNLQSGSNWRIVHCSNCNCRYRIPGLSSE